MYTEHNPGKAYLQAFDCQFEDVRRELGRLLEGEVTPVHDQDEAVDLEFLVLYENLQGEEDGPEDDTWEAIHQRPLDPRVVNLEALEHVQVLLPELKILGQEPESLCLVELARPQKPQDKVVIRAQKADVGPCHDHVAHLLDVRVEGVGVLVELLASFLCGLGAQAHLQDARIASHVQFKHSGFKHTVVWSVSTTDGIFVSRYEGGEAEIRCHYDRGYENYQNYSDIKGRFSLYGDTERRVFTLNVTNLTLQDAGAYWCTTRRNLTDIYTEIRLQVVKAGVSVGSGFITWRGMEGGNTHINCTYEQGFEAFPKYILKGGYLFEILIKTLKVPNQSPVWTYKGRYVLYDDTERRVFTVTIDNLNLEDAGTYWCGVESWGLDKLIQVRLTVDRGPVSPSRQKSSKPNTGNTKE
ncbi:unnamed protein product, partial [Coregonus sp. 'balchen']